MSSLVDPRPQDPLEFLAALLCHPAPAIGICQDLAFKRRIVCQVYYFTGSRKPTAHMQANEQHHMHRSHLVPKDDSCPDTSLVSLLKEVHNRYDEYSPSTLIKVARAAKLCSLWCSIGNTRTSSGSPEAGQCVSHAMLVLTSYKMDLCLEKGLQGVGHEFDLRADIALKCLTQRFPARRVSTSLWS